MKSIYKDDDESSPSKQAYRRVISKKTRTEFKEESLNKLPNDLKQFVREDEHFDTRYSYPEDYL